MLSSDPDGTMKDHLISFVGLIVGIAVVRLVERVIRVEGLGWGAALPAVWIATIAIWLPYYWYTLGAYRGAAEWFSGGLRRFFIALAIPIVFVASVDVHASGVQVEGP